MHPMGHSAFKIVNKRGGIKKRRDREEVISSFFMSVSREEERPILVKKRETREEAVHPFLTWSQWED